MHFTLANVDVLLDLLLTMSRGLQQYGEVRRVESLNLFTVEQVFKEFQGVVKAFEEDNPDLKGRGRVISFGELRSVSIVRSA